MAVVVVAFETWSFKCGDFQNHWVVDLKENVKKSDNSMVTSVGSVLGGLESPLDFLFV